MSRYDARPMFGLRPRKPRLTRRQQLAARPVRLIAGTLSDDDGGGGGRLIVPLHQRRWAGWLLRLPAGSTKTFEFDPLGRFVWDRCDGKRTVQQIARQLAKQYGVSEREAQVATESFLTTLARKGLVGAEVPKPPVAT